MRDTRSNEPLLILGLGGTGSCAVARVKKYFSERFGFSVTEDGALHDNLTEILVFDAEQSPRYLPSSEIKLPMGDYMRLNCANSCIDKPYIKEWLHPAMDVNDGTAYRRQLARLGIFNGFGMIYNTIRGRLASLMYASASGSGSPVPVQVKFVSGTVGATSSGILLDLAYIVRQVARELNCPVEIDAYLMLPDALIGRVGNDHAMIKAWNANTYALLKELDYLMQADGVVLEQRYTDNCVVSWNGAPFERVFLQRGMTEYGALIKGAYDKCLDTIAEYITQSFEFSAAQEFSIKSAAANMSSQLYAMFGEDAAKRVYHSLSMAGNADDIRRIELNELKLMYGDIMERLNYKGITDEEAAKFAEAVIGMRGGAAFPVDKPYLHRHPLPDMDTYDANTLRHIDHNEAPHINPYKHFDASLINSISDERRNLENDLRSHFLKMARDICCDAEKGPAYLQKLLCMKWGVIDYAGSYIERLKANYANIENNIRRIADICNYRHDEICRCSIITWALKKAQLHGEYMEEVLQLFEAKRRLRMYDAYIPVLEAFVTELGDFAHALSDCENMIADGNRQVERALEEINERDWLLASPWALDSMKRMYTDDNVKHKAAASIFADVFDMAEKRVWLGFGYSDPMKKLNSRIAETRGLVFGEIESMGLDMILQKCYDTSNHGEIVDRICSCLCPGMAPAAAELLDGVAGCCDPVLNYIRYYTDAIDLAAGVEKYMQYQGYHGLMRPAKDIKAFTWIKERYGIQLDEVRNLRTFEQDFRNADASFLYMGGADVSDPVKANWVKSVLN